MVTFKVVVWPAVTAIGVPPVTAFASGQNW